MKRAFKLFSLLIILLIFYSCEKQEKEELEAEFLESELNCYVCNPCSCEFIISNEISYLELETIKSNSSNCDTVSLPNIDFTNKTLLGKCVIVSGCEEAEFIRKIIKDETIQKYIYSIIIDTTGKAYCAYRSMNWATVPKLPEDYSVEFNVKIE